MANAPEIHRSSPIPYLRPVFLAGPTATGKSAIALTLAEQIGGEIITVDSMQVYCGLDIGTAKPTAEERRRVPHHLIDICKLNESFDTVQFVRHAQAVAREIQSRGHVPVFCGGTGLYFKALLEGVGKAPPGDPRLRAELEATPLEQLLTELRKRDRAAFESIDRQNSRRVVRAVEVIRLTGKPFSAQRTEWTAKNSKFQIKNFRCFTRAAADLHARINVRVDEMFARGLVDETRELLQHGLAENKFALQAIGYRQVVQHLRGELNLEKTIELVKTRTRQFAKRQLTWFRRHGNCEWIELKKDEPVQETVAKITASEE